jgi:hypothetical protein
MKDNDEAAKDWKVINGKIEEYLRFNKIDLYWDYWNLCSFNSVCRVFGNRVQLSGYYFSFYNHFIDGTFEHFSGVSGFDRYLVTSRILEEL